MSPIPDNDAMMEAARGLVGTPYKPAGHTTFGADCRGVVTLWFHSFGVELPLLMDVEPDNLDSVGIMDHFAPAPGPARMGDVVRFLGEEHDRHIGVWLGEYILHASKRWGCVFIKANRIPGIKTAPRYRLRAWMEDGA